MTVNNYLAVRDSEWMGPLFEFHGLSVDCIDKHEPNSESRRQAYGCDIIYGTNNEFGFDYLRDNMSREVDELVQRKHHYAMVDEVDSVLVDEARTPLIISGPVPKGDEHQFHDLKPRIQKLVDAQKKIISQYLLEAKKQLKNPVSRKNGGNCLPSMELVLAPIQYKQDFPWEFGVVPSLLSNLMKTVRQRSCQGWWTMARAMRICWSKLRLKSWACCRKTSIWFPLILKPPPLILDLTPRSQPL